MRPRSTVLLFAVAAVAACGAAQDDSQRNVDEFQRQYSPITCGISGECACPQAGTPKCAKCPFDTGSDWKDKKVCICTELDTLSKIECSAGRQFSPIKVVFTDAPPTSPKRTSPKRTSPKRTSPKRTSPKRTSAPPAAPKRTSAPPAAPKRTSAPPAAPKRTSAPPAAPKPTSAPPITPDRTGAPPTAPVRTGRTPSKPPAQEKSNRLAVGAGVGIGLGAFAVLTVGCFASWMLFTRSKGRDEHDTSPRKQSGGMGSDGMGSDGMATGGAGMMADSPGVSDSAGMGNSSTADAVYIDVSSSGQHPLASVPPQPPPGDMQPDFVNVTPPPLLSSTSATSDSAGAVRQSAFLSADTPPPAEISWDGKVEGDASYDGRDSGRHFLATSADTGLSGGTDGTGPTPPPSSQATKGGKDALATSADTAVSGGTDGTGSTPPPDWQAAKGERDILASTVDLDDSGATDETGPTPPPDNSTLRAGQIDILATTVDGTRGSIITD